MTALNLFDLTGKTALITGGSRGLGLQIAEALGDAGARLVISSRKPADLETAKAHLEARGVTVDYIVADNNKDEDILRLADEAIAKLGRVDILVNNLGIYEAVGFFEESDADWQRLFEVNVMSGVRLARHYLRGMLARGDGRVVFISSESGVSPAPEMAHYS
eukprot:gene29004-29400_t